MPANVTTQKPGLPEQFEMLTENFDTKVDQLFNRLRGRPWADRMFYTASQVGDYSLVWHLAAALAALLGGRREEFNLFRVSLVLGLESALVNGLLKSLVSRIRPVSNEPRPHYLRQPLTSSFPSGHASSAAVAAILLGEARTPSGRRLLKAAAAVTALSRIHVNIHHASDVLGGAAVGFLVGQIARRLWPLPRHP